MIRDVLSSKSFFEEILFTFIIVLLISFNVLFVEKIQHNFSTKNSDYQMLELILFGEYEN